MLIDTILKLFEPARAISLGSLTTKQGIVHVSSISSCTDKLLTFNN